jgi:NAD(P)-dependent dehydrogenase (short-subunit alcohol dehydrogenase family)
MRLLVVGASSGIGEAIARLARERGHLVAAAARRKDRLHNLGSDVVTIEADVTDEVSCGALVTDAVAELGGLDALVYAAGVAPLVPLGETDGDVWARVLATNVVGASLVTRAALPALTESHGRAAYLSMGHSGRPWPFLGAYSVSKAALEDLVRAWRTEHPEIGFTTVAIGPTATPMADGWDPATAGEAFEAWQRTGHLTTTDTMNAADVAVAVLGALESPVVVEDLRVMPAWPGET